MPRGCVQISYAMQIIVTETAGTDCRPGLLCVDITAFSYNQDVWYEICSLLREKRQVHGRGNMKSKGISSMIRRDEKMHIVDTQYHFVDGRRVGKDRRVFSYTAYFPERRLGQDRRCYSKQGKPYLYLVKQG